MALEKNCKNYYYNLGRCVAVVEIMVNRKMYAAVAINPSEKLRYSLDKAIMMERHNLHGELCDIMKVVGLEKLPSRILTALDLKGQYDIGYYHEKEYLDATYGGTYGVEETVVTETIPENVSPIQDNTLPDLER